MDDPVFIALTVRFFPMAKLWGGRFRQETDTFVEQFNASIGFDKRLYHADIIGSKAHVQMLAQVGILTQQECATLVQALDAVHSDIEDGHFVWRDSDEDVHMAIEAAVTAKVGDIGKKMHTARSRNDQVATDMRIFVKEAAQQIQTQMLTLLQVLVDTAERYQHTIMPAYTHLQPAQPIVFGHHLMAWCAMMQRDYDRLGDCLQRVDVLPLGSGALAGTTFPIDREVTKTILGFAEVTTNSLDAVSDRDFVIEFVHVAAISMMHLSRWSEELIVWACSQFQFIQLPDSHCTGSSMMPQKKNPDVAELIRGKSARVFGHAQALLVLMKGQPLAYNKDNQEDKEPLFDTVDTWSDCLVAMAGLVENLEADESAMRQALQRGYVNATDLAEYLVAKGIPFRQAHAIVGRLVAMAIEHQLPLEQLTLMQMQTVCADITEDVFAALDYHTSVAKRKHIGGCAPEQVAKTITEARQWLSRQQR